jgi:hypothetical protein
MAARVFRPTLSPASDDEFTPRPPTIVRQSRRSQFQTSSNFRDTLEESDDPAAQSPSHVADLDPLGIFKVAGDLDELSGGKKHHGRRKRHKKKEKRHKHKAKHHAEGHGSHKHKGHRKAEGDHGSEGNSSDSHSDTD